MSGSLINQERNKKLKVAILSLPENDFRFPIIGTLIITKHIRENCKDINVKLIEKGCPLHYLLLTDMDCVYVPYFYTALTSESPHWRCKPNSYLYEKLKNEFDELWNINQEII